MCMYMYTYTWTCTCMYICTLTGNEAATVLEGPVFPSLRWRRWNCSSNLPCAQENMAEVCTCTFTDICIHLYVFPFCTQQLCSCAFYVLEHSFGFVNLCVERVNHMNILRYVISSQSDCSQYMYTCITRPMIPDDITKIFAHLVLL